VNNTEYWGILVAGHDALLVLVGVFWVQPESTHGRLLSNIFMLRCARQGMGV